VSAARTTTNSPGTEVADFLCGFVAAEGHFGHAAGSNAFSLVVQLGSTDAASCALLADALGIGRVQTYARRKNHYQDEVHYVVRRLRDLVEVIVPLMDEHLPPSRKRRQYLAWRDELLRYWRDDRRQVRSCTRAGCERPRRAKGLCRRHYYAAFGR